MNEKQKEIVKMCVQFLVQIIATLCGINMTL